uniref:diacylglycerol O-acyltransferase n=1 Tax=Ditylenchus dipsaci TaxID=166011 RepID=A0A915E696_9BILA
MPIFYGRGVVSNIVGLMPYRKEIVTVVGAPIKVTENANPSEEEVDKVHSEYCKQLANLFNQHKTKYGISEDIELEFV